MKPPGKTTLDRMARAAQLEAERLEITQDFWVREGRLKEPMPNKVNLRDDFAGIVRLIDLIQSDKVILERLAAAGRRAETVPVAASKETGDEEPADE